MRRAPVFRCVFLGRTAEHFHHTSGRGVDGKYLDPKLVVPTVRHRHVLVHSCWGAVGIGDGVGIDRNVLRLRRNGLLLVQLAEHHGLADIVLPSFFVAELGLMLQQIADTWEETK